MQGGLGKNGEGDEWKGGKETLRGIDRCDYAKSVCLRVIGNVKCKNVNDRNGRHNNIHWPTWKNVQEVCLPDWFMRNAKTSSER